MISKNVENCRKKKLKNLKKNSEKKSKKPENRDFQEAVACLKIVVSSSKSPRSKLLEFAVNLRYFRAQ